MVVITELMAQANQCILMRYPQNGKGVARRLTQRNPSVSLIQTTSPSQFKSKLLLVLPDDLFSPWPIMFSVTGTHL